MSIVLLFGGVAVVVTALAFVLNRRFGVLALALAAGALLAELWAEWLAAGVIGGLGVSSVAGLPNGVVATIILTVGPLVLLLITGPKGPGKLLRLISAVLVGVLAAAVLVRPLGKFMTLDAEAMKTYKLLSDWWHYAATVGLVAGLLDMSLPLQVKAPAAKKTKR